MSKEALVTGVDVGSSKICAVIGERGREGRVHLIGVGVAPSRGIRRAVVVNIEQAVESIAAAVEKAERVSGYKIISGLVSVGGGHIGSQNNRGVVAVGHADRVISEEDVQRALESARVISLPGDRQIVHVLPRSYVVDGQDGVFNPVGMVGYRLDVETHIVTAGATAIQNLTQCLYRAGVHLDGLVLEPLASASAVLSDEEKEMGVALVDIGGGTTNVAVFIEGSVCHTATIGLGGGHVTNDIAVGLRTPLGSAEELKLKHGNVLPADDQTVSTATFGGEGVEVSRRHLCEIMAARMEEISTLVGEEIMRAGYAGLLPAGIVLTGGVAETPGIELLASEVCRAPVRIGRPRGVTGLGEMVRGPAYAAAIGLLLWGAGAGRSAFGTDGAQAPRPRRGGDSRRSHGESPYGRVAKWLKSFLP